jgi:hypothetical protein
MKRARVIAAHRAPDRPPIQVAPGDEVTLGDRDDTWPQFVWTTLANGLGGWIPWVLFDREQGAATAHTEYDTRELDADVGDLLVLHREMADWWWAEKIQKGEAHGASGWIPAHALQIIDDGNTDEN